MITIAPILVKDMEDARHEYLRDEFHTHRFGRRSLLLFNPDQSIARPTDISQAEASNLLHDRKVDGAISDNQRVGAWRFSFSGSQSLSVLYALSPERYAARIENVQVEAARTALGELAGCLLDEAKQKGFMGTLLDDSDTASSSTTGEPLEARQNGTGPTPEKLRECTILVFSSAVARDQSPHLQTTAFLLNRSYSQSGQMRTIASAEDMSRLQAPLNESYAGALDYFLSKAIGPFKRVGNIDELRIVGVPQALVQKFYFDPSFNRLELQEQSSKGLHRNEVVAQWRAQAERFGWGAKQAEKLLRALERERVCDAVKAHIQTKFSDLEKACRGTVDSTKRILKSERSTPVGRKHKSKDHDLGHSY